MKCKNKLIIVSVVMIFVVLSTVIGSLEGPEIEINIDYLNNSHSSGDLNGVVTSNNLIDFTVKNSLFNWKVDQSNLCTKWEVLSIETDSITVICNGAQSCCNFIDLIPSSNDWDDVLSLNYGKYGATLNNKVSARVIYVDYSLDFLNPYSNIHYSSYEYLYAVFTGSDKSSERNFEYNDIGAEYTVVEVAQDNFATSNVEKGIAPTNKLLTEVPTYGVDSVSQLSTILELNETFIKLNISSPINTRVLESGEGISINFSTNISVHVNYSLDEGIDVELSNGTIFGDFLEGLLQFNTLANGVHNTIIKIIYGAYEPLEFNYSFEIQDIYPPIIDISYESNDLNNTVIMDSNNMKEFTIDTDEYSSINYQINNLTLNILEANIDQTYSINVTLQEGINHITANATDLQGNSETYNLQFNFSYFSCSDGIQNGDESGIDCGGSCSECVPFNISIEKSTYDFGEDIPVTILSRANSIVNLTVLYGNDVVYDELITGYSPDYPIYITTLLDNIDLGGEYSIQVKSEYKGNLESDNVVFYVNPPLRYLNVDIGTNDSTINEGESVKFTASVTGESGSLTYKWDIFNDGSVDSYSSEFIKKFDENGSFDVNVTVIDGGSTASDIATITVRKGFNVTIIVKDNSDNKISDAIVEFEDFDDNTSSEGIVTFIVNRGTHEMDVIKEGYISYANDSIKIDENKTIEINLSVDNNDHGKPVVSIISPGENQTINDNTVDIFYRVEDDAEVDCMLHTKEDESWWIEWFNHSNVPRDAENIFTLSGLLVRSYEYRIKCIDKHGNAGYSPQRMFYISTIVEEEPEEAENQIDPIIEEIDLLSEKFEKLAKSEKEVFDILEMGEILDDAKKQLLRYKRDLNNLIWRKFNESEMIQAEINIYAEVEKLKENIPADLKVLDSKEFVTYPNEDDVRNLTISYLDFKSIEYSKRDLKNILEKSKELQSLITITTKVKSVEIEYLSHKKEKITLIEKNLKMDDVRGDLSIIEYIPKELSESVNDIDFLFEYEVIKEDPIIKVSLQNTKKLVYYIRKEIVLDDVKKTSSILVNEDPVFEGPKITGFAVIDNIKSSFVSSSNKRIFIEVIIIIVLVLVYLAYTLKGSKIRYYLMDREVIAHVKQIQEAIDSATGELKKDQYEEAKSVYKEIQSKFKELPKDMKKEVYKNIIVLSNKLDVSHINNLIDTAKKDLKNNQKSKAATAYNQVSKIYLKIAPQYKSQVLKNCNELRSQLGKNVD